MADHPELKRWPLTSQMTAATKTRDQVWQGRFVGEAATACKDIIAKTRPSKGGFRRTTRWCRKAIKAIYETTRQAALAIQGTSYTQGITFRAKKAINTRANRLFGLRGPGDDISSFGNRPLSWPTGFHAGQRPPAPAHAPCPAPDPASGRRATPGTG